jgi:hypothetical protein
MPQAKTVHYGRTIGKISNGVLAHIRIETWKVLVMHIDQLSTENGFSAPLARFELLPFSPETPFWFRKISTCAQVLPPFNSLQSLPTSLPDNIESIASHPMGILQGNVLPFAIPSP